MADTIPVFLTFDLFLRDWNDAVRGEVWACVQPHVRFSDLLGYIPASTSGTDKTYTWLFSQDPTHAEQLSLVPVNFPDKTDLTLELFDTNGTALVSLLNSRTISATITNGKDFAAVNREPTSDHRQVNRDKPPEEPPLPLKPFAEAYNESLRTTAGATGMTAVRLAHMLRLAFWGGTIRRIPPGAFTDLDKLHLMTLPPIENWPIPLPDGTIITNLHSLCGLMFPLGKRSDLTSLHHVKTFRLTLSDTGAIPHSPTIDTHMAAFLADLQADTAQDPAAHTPIVPTVQWDNAWAQRVYIVENRLNFTLYAEMGDQNRWFRKRLARKQSAVSGTPNDFTRLTVAYRGDPFPNTVQTLTWRAWRLLEIRLVPYRGVASAVNADETQIPLRLVPVPRDKAAFENATTQQHWYDMVQLRDATGRDRKPDFTLIGRYDFPFDDEETDADAPAVLLFGKRPLSAEFALLLPIPGEVITRQKGYYPNEDGLPPDADRFGARWEADEAALQPWDGHTVDLLECLDGLPPTERDKLIPSLGRRQDVEFHWAQSVSTLEGRAVITYPKHAMANADPGVVNAREEYKHDLINYNALNVRADWHGARRYLNPWGQTLPIHGIEDGASGPLHIFRFAVIFPVTAPEAFANSDVQDYPTFYRTLYDGLGQPRTLMLELEHTYGVTLPLLPTPPPLATFADFPPVLPADAVWQKSASVVTPGTEPQPEETHFLTVHYDDTGGGERAVLRFKTEMLTPAWVTGAPEAERPARRLAQQTAWRSVAEMAHAERMVLHADVLRFDFREALKNDREMSLASGLKQVDIGNAFPVPVTNVLKAAATKWLSHDFAQSEISIDLPKVNGKKVGEVCNVIAFRLALTRPDAMLPTDSAAWELIRPLPTMNEEGQMFAPISSGAIDEPIRRAFSEYVKTRLKTASAAIAPANEDWQTAERFRRALGGDTEPAANELGGPSDIGSAWIVPPGDPQDPLRELEAAVCPLTFLPVRRDPILGDDTFLLLRRYCVALQALLELRISAVALANDTAAKWKTFFDGMQTASAAPRSNLQQLRNTLSKLIRSVPHAAQVMDRPAREVAEALADGATPISIVVQDALTDNIYRDFSLFATAKALLYTRLRPVQGQMVTGDFFGLESFKSIREFKQLPEKGVKDNDRYTFRDALRDLRIRDNDWFGYIETLDDARYDNAFVFHEPMTARPYEQILKSIIKGKPDDDKIVITGDQPYAPAKDTQNRPLVHLPSRAPLLAPVTRFAGKIDACQTQQDVDTKLRKGDSMDLIALEGGSLTPPLAGKPAVMVVARTDSFPRSARRDDFVFSALYRVRGDEESETPGQPAAEAFVNDVFHLGLSEARPSTEMRAVASLDNDLATLFAELSKGLSPEKIPLNIADLLIKPEILENVRNKFVPIEQADNPVETAYATVHIGQEGIDGFTLTFSPQPPQGSVEAFLLQGGDLRNPVYYLLFNFEVLVWNRYTPSLTQTRNKMYGFRPDFAQSLTARADAFPYQPTNVVHVDYERTHLPQPLSPIVTDLDRTNCTLEEIVRVALYDNKNVFEDETQKLWRKFDMSVTVFHEQRSFMPIAYVDTTGDTRTELADSDFEGRFPLTVTFIPANDDTAQHRAGWFPTPYRQFQVELQWSSASNLPFFRAARLRVQFSD